MGDGSAAGPLSPSSGSLLRRLCRRASPRTPRVSWCGSNNARRSSENNNTLHAGRLKGFSLKSNECCINESRLPSECTRRASEQEQRIHGKGILTCYIKGKTRRSREAESSGYIGRPTAETDITTQLLHIAANSQSNGRSSIRGHKESC